MKSKPNTHQRIDHAQGWAVCAVIIIMGLFPAGASALTIRYEGTGCPLPTTVVQTINRELPRIIRCHWTLFRKSLPADFTITYHVCSTREEYNFLTKQLGIGAGTSGFARNSKPRTLLRQRNSELTIISAATEVTTWRQETTRRLVEVLLHETTHAVSQAYLVNPPLWFKEGSAELLGVPSTTRNDIDQLEAMERWQTLRKLLDDGKLPPLRAFLKAGSYAEWGRLCNGNTGQGYRVSYSLFHFFLSHRQTVPFLTSLVDSQLMAESRNPNETFVNYLEQHWQGGLALFEKGWHSWIRLQAQKYSSFKADPKD